MGIPPEPFSPVGNTPPVGGCTAAVSVNAWTGGFVATVKVTAGSSAINGWSVGLSLPAGATTTNSWNTSRSGSAGAVRFGNVAYNAASASDSST